MATSTSEFEKHYVGRYLIIGNSGDWRIMEQFGSFRMLKKKFKTVAAAQKRTEQMAKQDELK